MEQNFSLTQKNKLEQTQTLSARQFQSLDILAMPSMELEHRVEQELVENPVLEFAQPESSVKDPEENETDSSAENPESLDPNREDYEEHLDSLAGSGEFLPSVSNTTAEEEEERRNYLFDSIESEVSLQEKLMEQLRFAAPGPKIRAAVEYLIGSLDGNGYLQTSLADVAQSTESTEAEAEQALKILQGFDPPGIGARDLPECLLLQLHAQNIHDATLEKLITEHLDDLAHNRLPKIAEEMHLTMEQLQQAVGKIKKLQPHPGASESSSSEQIVIPEITVREEEDSFVLQETDIPYTRLEVSKYYQNMMSSPGLDSEAKSYLREKIDKANQLIHALSERKRTIFRIAELILSMQYDFMKHGPRYLKPMTMKQIADKLGIHETTVSRAVAGKYLRTPYGLFEFKYFFSGGFRNDEGEELSAHAIKDLIRKFVEEEDSAKPLSDDKLSEMLKEQGFKVARRTVAKYRESLMIPSSQLRKTY